MILNHHPPFWSFFVPNNALPRRSQRRDGRGRGGRGGVGGGKGTRKCAPPHSSSSSSSSVMSTRCVLCCGDAQIVLALVFFLSPIRKWLNPRCFKTAKTTKQKKLEQLLNLNWRFFIIIVTTRVFPSHHHNKQPHALESGGDSLSLFERSCAKRKERDEEERKCLTSKYAR